MRRVSTEFVPILLANDQEENRFEISQELPANANDNENFLKNIITGNETWVYGYDVECIVHHEFLPRGQMVNKQLYQEV